ncbi:MAG: hypothetical protein OEZ43_19550 [Gammaproteobacteria bacterium]|nr:hypothetical protein [Gammaproteobacteria bacterium]
MKRFIFACLILIFTSACTHSLHLVHVGGVEPFKTNAGEYISATSEQFVFMGLVGDTLYVERAYEQFIAQCKGGEITGVTTRYSTSHGFYSWTNRIFLQGRCSRENTRKI